MQLDLEAHMYEDHHCTVGEIRVFVQCVYWVYLFS